MPAFGWVLIAIAVVIALVVGLVVAPYNRLVRLRNTLQESWRQVDVELNRRYDLIPNLVETVKGYAAHESGTLEEIVRLRNQAAAIAPTAAPAVPASDNGANPQRAEVESQLSQQIGRLLVSVEAYPQLQANANFVELQRQLADTEDRIAAGRRFYNANVRAYNTAIESMPTNLIAGMFHFQQATYFEVTDPNARQAPTVSFGTNQSQAFPGQNPSGQNYPGQTGQLPPAQAPSVQWNQQSASQLGMPQQVPVERPDQLGQ